MSTPFDVGLVIAHLRVQVPTLKRVRGAAEYAAVTILRDFVAPEAFVIPIRERVLPNGGAGRQAARAQFGVVIAGTNYSYEMGMRALDDASVLVGQVREKLIGWTPTRDGAPLRGGRPCELVQGEVLDYSVDTVLWSDVFQTQHFIGATP